VEDVDVDEEDVEDVDVDEEAGMGMEGKEEVGDLGGEADFPAMIIRWGCQDKLGRLQRARTMGEGEQGKEGRRRNQIRL